MKVIAHCQCSGSQHKGVFRPPQDTAHLLGQIGHRGTQHRAAVVIFRRVEDHIGLRIAEKRDRAAQRFQLPAALHGQEIPNLLFDDGKRAAGDRQQVQVCIKGFGLFSGGRELAEQRSSRVCQHVRRQQIPLRTELADHALNVTSCQRHAEHLTRRFRQLVGFVYDDDAVLGENGASTLTAVDGICQQQVVLVS